jgi:PAP_fibrillin
VIADLAGEERGIFGLDGDLRREIHARVEDLEAASPVPAPAASNAAAVGGAWRLLYTTLTVLGRKRVRLAIGTKNKPGFVMLGPLYQVVDVGASETTNIVVFKLALGGSGTFKLTAGYETVSSTRVAVTTKSAVLEPQKLEELLGDNIALLSQIFDPTGHLDITYLDDDLRIGRDDKGEIFVLERCEMP